LRVLDDLALALRGLRCAGADPGRLQGGAVAPRRVAVVGVKKDRPARFNDVQVAAVREAPGKRRIEPATAEDPRLVGVSLRVAPYTLLDLRQGRGPCQVDLLQSERAVEKVGVRVVEAGEDEATGDVVLARVRPRQGADLRRGPDPDDPIAAHRDR